jgi:tetratricopeptide (TPR) repeat protein
MKKTKAAVLDVSVVTVNVTVQDRVTEFNFGETGEELQPLFYRNAQFMLPAYVVRQAMPTLTCRHLEKATIHLLQKRPDQALLAFKRAVASAIEPMTLIKVGLACFAENHPEEALAALKRALKYAAHDSRSVALVNGIATHLNYDLS